MHKHLLVIANCDAGIRWSWRAS